MSGLLLRAAVAPLAPIAARFEAALRDPARAQARLQRRLAARMATTAWGRAHGVRGPGDWARLPIVDWPTLEPWLARERAGERRALVPDPVLFWEKTSGSSGLAKLVPYTAALRRDVSRMFAIWAHDVVRHGPALRRGKLWFSVSPRFSTAPTTPEGGAGVKVGTDDDTDFLDGWLRALLSPFLVRPREAERAPDGPSFQRALALGLLAEPGLEVMSIWNPSFLGVLLDRIEAERDALLGGLGDRVPARRLGVLRAAFAPASIDWPAVWPALRLVSAWRDAHARPAAEALARRLPQAVLQGKGLLATEAAVTVPLMRAGGAVPLVERTVIELVDDAGTVGPLVEAQEGASYALVLGQSAGLCRYRIGDRVRIRHRWSGVPVLEFLGREGGVVDLVGEKLSEPVVAEALAGLELGACASALVPARSPLDHYVLVVDADPAALPPAAELAARLDAALARAHHYGHARALGQLAPVRAVVGRGLEARLVEAQLRRGMLWGDIKPRPLLPWPADAELLEALR